MSTKEPIYNPDDKLEDALAQFAAGISLETILTEAGDDAEWLRPMLEVAARVNGLQQAIPIPPPDASLQRLLSYGKALEATPDSDEAASLTWKQKLSQLFSTGHVRLAVGLVAAVVLIALLGGVLNSVAQDSLPGQPFYQVKRAGEALQLSFAQNSGQRERLTRIFNRRRQTEIKQLLERGIQAEINFTSSVETVTATEITVNGLTTQITPDTEIVGTVAVGAQVQVRGITQPPDTVNAFVITVIEPAPDALTPSPTSLNIVVPTLTQTPSPQPQATTLPVPSATSVTAPSETDPPPTATLTPLPTLNPIQAPATDEAPNNDNANENEDLSNGSDDVDNNDIPLTTATATSRPPADDSANIDDGNVNEDDIIDDIDDGNDYDFNEEFDDNANSGGGDGNSGNDNSGSGNSGSNNDNSGPGNGDDGNSGSESGDDDND